MTARKLIATLYERGTSSPAHASTCSALSQCDYVVLNANGGPYNQGTITDQSTTPDTTIASMITNIHNNGKLALGYVNTGGSNWHYTGSNPQSYSDLMLINSGGTACTTLTKNANMVANDPTGGAGTSDYWSHFAQDITDFDLGTGLSGHPYQNAYVYYAYNGHMYKQAPQGGGMSCFKMLGYISQQVDTWLKSTANGGYGADGIWFDNVFACYHANPTLTTDPDPGAGGNSTFNFYDRVGGYVRSNYPGKIRLFNGGNAAPPEWWVTHDILGCPFDIWNLREMPYNGASTVWPDSTNIPAYIVNGTYSAVQFSALMYNALSITSSYQQTFWNKLYHAGITYGFSVDSSSYVYPVDLQGGVASLNGVARQNTDAIAAV